MWGAAKWRRAFSGNTARKTEPIGAGIPHKSQINPVAVEVMREIGVDIWRTHQR